MNSCRKCGCKTPEVEHRPDGKFMTCPECEYTWDVHHFRGTIRDMETSLAELKILEGRFRSSYDVLCDEGFEDPARQIPLAITILRHEFVGDEWEARKKLLAEFDAAKEA